MKIENYNGEDRFVSNPNTKEDQKEQKKIGRQQPFIEEKNEKEQKMCQKTAHHL